ncbi:phospholipase A2 group XV-like [Neocloeon triangulifer]|uniref:phospholipase A2 group XV-like n=1 Tax=Neocloeon triangulifer TaxID=2078957 RepID=UPI00286F7946|nr:phospholipase A2 group XV-like [Neocloeon triangulifer]
MNGSDFVLLLVFAVSAGSSARVVDPAPIRHPVILVPGDGGSQIDARLNKTEVVHYLCEKTTGDFFNTWLNLELLVPVVIDCLVDNMRLVYDNTTRTTSNSPGVETRIPGFGNTSSVEWLDPTELSPTKYFNPIADILVKKLNYSRGVNLHGVPYDFRKAPNELGEVFVKMKALIEETVARNGQSAVIVTHSMGGLLALTFLQLQSQTWKDKHVKSLVTLAAPWGGSVKTVKVFAIGDNLGVFVLSGGTLRDQQITSPSLAWLLPSPLFWKPDETLVVTPQKNYSLTNLRDFFDDIDWLTGWEMKKDTEKYVLNFTAPGVEVHCAHGVGVKTVEKLKYTKDKFPDSTPDLIMGDGDGTVNLRSLEGCTKWTEAQNAGKKIYHQTFPGLDHMDALRDKIIAQFVHDLLQIKLNVP